MKQKKQGTDHHVYPLRWLWSNNSCNRVDLSLETHQSLHKILDLKQLDVKLEPFYKTHTLEFIRSEETTKKQYKLVGDFFANYDMLSPQLQKIVLQKIKHIISYHLKDRETLTQDQYYKYSKEQLKAWKNKASAKDIQDLVMLDRMIASDIVLHVRRKIKRLMPESESILTLTPHTTSNIHLIPLTIHGRHTPHNQLDNIITQTYWQLVEIISDRINLWRRRRTARKYTNDKLIFWSDERNRRGDIQKAYFENAEDVFHNEWHDTLWTQCEAKMTLQMLEDANHRKNLSWDTLTLPQHPNFHTAHAKSLEICWMIWDKLKQIFTRNEYVLR